MQYLLGTPADAKQIPRFGETQLGLQQSITDRIQGLLGQPSNFEPIAAQARQQYQEQTLPAIKNQFSTPGASSAYQNAIARGASNLEANLAALGSNYNLQQQQLVPALGKLALEPQFETIYEPKQSGALQDFASQLLPVLGQTGLQAVLDYFGGGTNQQQGLGGALGQAAGQALGGNVGGQIGQAAGNILPGVLAGTGIGAGIGNVAAGAAAPVAGAAGAAGGAVAPIAGGAAVGAGLAPAAGTAAGGGAAAGGLGGAAGTGLAAKVGGAIGAIAPVAMGIAAAAGLAYGLWDMGKSIFTPSKGDKNQLKLKELMKQKADARKEYEAYRQANPNENLPDFKQYFRNLKAERDANKTKYKDFVKTNSKIYDQDTKIVANKSGKYTQAEIDAAKKRIEEFDAVKKDYKAYTKSLPPWIIV